MKGCKTEADFESAIEHGYAINDLHPGQTQETTVQFLDLTQQNARKIDGKYTVGSQSLKDTVTSRIGKNFSNPFVNRELLEDQGNIGNFTHESIDNYVKSFLGDLEGKSVNSALNYLKDLDYALFLEGLKKIEQVYDRKLSPDASKNLFMGIRGILIDIYKQQRVINRLTNTEGIPIIRIEQIVLDPKKNIGGTLDMLVIFSDNTGMIIDFKSKINKYDNKDVNGFILDIERVVTKTDKEKYKLQTGEYGRILRESYGLKSIRKVQIIPIVLNVNKEFNNPNKYKKKIDSLFFPGQDPSLEKILPFSGTTNFKTLDDFIRKIDEKIAKLEKQLREKGTDKTDLKDKLEALEKSKKEILLNNNMNNLIDYINSVNEKLKSKTFENLSLEELQEYISELKLYSSLASSTYEYRKYLVENVTSAKGKTGKEIADEISSRISDIILNVDDTIKQLEYVLYHQKIVALIEAKTGFNIVDGYGNYIPFNQEGYFGNWFYQLSQFENPIFQSLRKILDEVNFKVRQEQDKIVEEITLKENKVYTWLKENGKTHKDLIDILINPNTDNFYGKYTTEYGKTLETLTVDQFPEYYNINPGYMESYNAKLEEKIQNLDPNLTDSEKQQLIERFKEYNSLALENGKPKYPKAWYNAKRFNKLNLKENPKFYRPEYKYIMSIPVLKEYYEMFEKYNIYFRDVLGVEYSKLPNNFLPNIRKTSSERLTEFGAIDGISSSVSDYLKDFSVREDDKSYDDSFDERKSIPIFFLNRFRNADGLLNVGEKSYQFGRSLALFTKMALNHQYLEYSSAEILALQSFLTDNAEQISTNKGKPILDPVGNVLTEKLNKTDLPKIFDAFVDMYLYGVNIQPELFDKSGKAEKILLKAKEYFTLKALGLNLVAATGSFLSAKTQAIIEGNKGIIYNTDDYKETLQDSWTNREKFLAINAYFDPMSHRLNNPRIAGEDTFGEKFYSDPTMRGWVNKYVNSRMLMNAFSIGDQYIEEMVLASMAKNYYVDEVGNLKRMKSEGDKQKYKDRTIWNLFNYTNKEVKFDIPKEQLENVFQSFRRAVQAGQSRIKGTIPEEDKAYWQSQLLGSLVMHFKSWVPGIIFERFGKVKYDSRIDSIYMGKYVALGTEFNNPDKLAAKEFFRQIVFPKITQFAKHLFLFGYAGKLNNKKDKLYAFNQWIDLNPHYKGKVTFEEFDDIQQKQLRSMMQELRIILLFAGLILMLGFDWDDDGEKDYKQYLFTRKLMSVLYKTKQELSFVYNPVDFANMIKNPIPTISLVSDVYKTIANTGDEILDVIFGEERFIGGEEKDKQPIFYHTHRWIPGFAGFARFFDFFNKDISYESTQ